MARRARCALLRFEWDPREFAEWHANELNAGAATMLSARIRAATEAGDAQLNTRYQLHWLVERGVLRTPTVGDQRPKVIVPLFASRQAYLGTDVERFDEHTARQVTVDLVLDALRTAPPDVPLEDVVRLRDRGFLTHQVTKLREWRHELFEDLADCGDDDGRWSRRIERAELDLKNAISDYEAAMGAVIEEQRRAARHHIALGAQFADFGAGAGDHRAPRRLRAARPARAVLEGAARKGLRLRRCDLDGQ